MLASVQRADRPRAPDGETGEAVLDSQCTPSGPFAGLAGAGDHGVHAGRVAAAREDADRHRLLANSVLTHLAHFYRFE
jgi:hypothetical protein